MGEHEKAERSAPLVMERYFRRGYNLVLISTSIIILTPSLKPYETYKRQLEQSFSDQRFNTALSFVAVKEDKVIGRIDASLISSRSDASCFSAYLDWICVLKSERHNKVAQKLLNALREECKTQGAGVLIALMANNDEAQKFYRSVEDASIHDTGIWIDIK